MAFSGVYFFESIYCCGVAVFNYKPYLVSATKTTDPMNAAAASEQLSFKRDLEPILEMLEDRGKVLSKSDWIRLVDATKQRIIDAPEQYLAGRNKTSDTLRQQVEMIFSERLN